MGYSVQDTPSGAKTLVLAGEKEIRLHSAFDPVKEAGRAVAQFDPGKKEIIVVLGLGLGYHAFLLKEKFPGRKILVVEHDREVCSLAKKTFPEQMRTLHILCDTDDLPSFFEQFDVSAFKGFAVYTHRASYLLYPQFYDGYVIEMNRYVSSKISDLLTRFEFEEKWAENIIRNIPNAFTGGCVHDLTGAFKGYPGVIVSAGPSLKKNAKLLASLSGRALVACVDTSFRVMEKMGISPHIVMSLDAQKYSARHFLGISDAKPYLLADMVSCPKVARDYRGRVIVSATSKYYNDESGNVLRETTPLMDWVEQYIPGIGDVQSGGSVATSLFDFLLNAGCDPIILVGQDLAYTGREIHTGGTYHNDEWLTMTNRTLSLDTINQRIVRKRKIKYVEAWGGGEVITDFVLDLYRQWFEDSCGKVNVTVINATEGGARIKNAQEMTLVQVLETAKEQKKDPRAIIDGIYQRRGKKDPEPFLSAARRAMAIIEPLAAYSGKEDLSGAEEFARQALRDRDCAMIFSPYLKKTNAYLNRHSELDEKKAFSLVTKDIVRGSAVLARLLPECCAVIEGP